MTTLALKFLTEQNTGPFSGFEWPLPRNGKPGKWVRATGDIVACENGIHACTFATATQWLRPNCYVTELSGVKDAGDKLVARKGRLIRRVDSWDEGAARLFAADCAFRVLPIFEKRRPDDPRPREAIRAARAFARHPTEKNRRKMDAAWDAARAAARAAAGAWQAWQAWDAAWDAARAAAGAWQADRLRHYIDAPEVLS